MPHRSTRANPSTRTGAGTSTSVRRRRVLALVLVVAVLGGAVWWIALRPGSTEGTSPAVTSAPTSTGPAATGAPTSTAPRAQPPLAGVVVGIDPGHNGANYTDPTAIDQPIFNGRSSEACDTTGTETDSGYTEATFNFNVAQNLAADLRAEGAQVVLTRDSNSGVGPCVTQRATIINDAHAAVAIDIHADGGPSSGRGFTILEPVADGPNDAVIAASALLARDLRASFLSGTGMPVSTYDGTDGLAPATTWPASTWPPSRRSSSSAATCATPPTPGCSSPRPSSRPRRRAMAGAITSFVRGS